MRRNLLVIVLLMACVTVAAGQNSETTVKTTGGVSGNTSGSPQGSSQTTIKSKGVGESRWEFTGALGFDFSHDHLSLSFSPQVGYAVKRFFVVGGGLNYNYYSNYNYDYSIHSLGANVFARLYLLRYITFHIQPEVFVSWRNPATENYSQKVFAAALAGAGITLPIAPGSYISAMLYYDVLQHERSPYGKGIFYSVGYGFRF